MYLLGVDGGTTKTIALISDDEGNIHSCARGEGSNWSGEDVSIPMGVVSDVVRVAQNKIGAGKDNTEVGVFTLAGADWPEDHLRREVFLSAESLCKKVIVKNDSFGGLRAGTDKPYGMVIAVGTGMNASVITPFGEEWSFGYYETFGGAGTIAREAFEAVLRAEDGRGQHTSLTSTVLKILEFPTVEAMLRAFIAQKIDTRRMYSIPPFVFEAAFHGDPVAVGIIVRQGIGLAEYVTAMARRFKMTELEFDVVLAGSIFKGVGPLLIETIAQEIHKVVPRAIVVRSTFEPVVGSLLLAFDALRIPVTDKVKDNIINSLPQEQFFSTA